MKNAKWNGENLAAINYDIRIHGENIYCCCGAKVICVIPNNDEREPFFKTTGRGDSQHKPGCREIRNLHINYIEKAIKYIDTIGSCPYGELEIISFELGQKKEPQKGNIGTDVTSGNKNKPNYVNKPNQIISKLHHSIKS